MPEDLVFERMIQAPVEQVYRAFTNANGLKEWLCDRSVASPGGGGLFYVGWNDGYYASGTYSTAEPFREVAFSWNGKSVPIETQVCVELEGVDGKTNLRLTHHGDPASEHWQKHSPVIRENWELSLARLAAVLEQGPDPRIVKRPMIGIGFDNPDGLVPESLGAPVKQGLVLNTVLEGMGAHKAGLQRGDIIVEVDSVPISDFYSIRGPLSQKQAGDTVAVEYYRGQERCHASMTLSHRPIPAVPLDAEGLADAVQAFNHREWETLSTALEGVTEAEASIKPSADEWSIKEVLAHLIQGELAAQYILASEASDQGGLDTGYPGNLNGYIAATAARFGTMENLILALAGMQAEMVAFLRALPAEFAARKSSIWKMGFFLLDGVTHAEEHAAQIRAALENARAVLNNP